MNMSNDVNVQPIDREWTCIHDYLNWPSQLDKVKRPDPDDHFGVWAMRLFDFECYLLQQHKCDVDSIGDYQETWTAISKAVDALEA